MNKCSNLLRTYNQEIMGINKSNIKGWHSKDFTLQDNEPKNFIKFISAAIENVMIDMNWDKEKQEVNINNMWAIINTGGSTNLRHQHGNSTISGAYYVRAPKIQEILVMIQDRHLFIHILLRKLQTYERSDKWCYSKRRCISIVSSYLDHSVMKIYLMMKG